MIISELTTYSTADLQIINDLMHELSAESFCSELKLKAVIDDVDSHLYVAREMDEIVSSACLCVVHTTEHTLGFVESVVVSSKHRGRHIGQKMMEHIQTEAGRLGVDRLHLTSNPKRVAANLLYQKLGFESYGTNVYRLNIPKKGNDR